jgi:hypothetical protein
LKQPNQREVDARELTAVIHAGSLKRAMLLALAPLRVGTITTAGEASRVVASTDRAMRR